MLRASLVRGVLVAGLASALTGACDDAGGGPSDAVGDAIAKTDAEASGRADGGIDGAGDAPAVDAPPDTTGAADTANAGPDTAASDVPPAAGRTSEKAPSREGLEYHGAIAIFRPQRVQPLVTTSDIRDAAVSGGEWIEISAPIWPKVLTLYQGEGANYPTTPAGELALARASALTFETLLGACQPSYAGLVLASPDGPAPTEAQIDNNYRLLSDCAYQQFAAKPYWIPQLLADVDICADQLGPDWHLISEADLDDIGTDDFATIKATLDAVGGADGFYFSLAVIIRRTDGSIARGEIDPTASPRIAPLVSLNGLPYDPKVHNEASGGLRCLRRTIE